MYDETESSAVGGLMYANGIPVNEIAFHKIGLEEYYLQLMSRRKGGTENGSSKHSGWQGIL